MASVAFTKTLNVMSKRLPGLEKEHRNKLDELRRLIADKQPDEFDPNLHGDVMRRVEEQAATIAVIRQSRTEGVMVSLQAVPDQVSMGTVVTLKDLDEKEKFRIWIGTTTDVRFLKDKMGDDNIVSVDAPIAKTMIDEQLGVADEFEVNGSTYKILNIELPPAELLETFTPEVDLVGVSHMDNL